MMCIRRAIVFSIFWFCFLFLIFTVSVKSDESVPVVYSTDLFHPHDDPDDHFDIAALFAIQEFEIKAVILDQGKKQEKKPGSIPLRQLVRLGKKEVPYAIGLSRPLKSPQDKALSEPGKYQKGVRLIIKALKESDKPVWIITVGSLRDVAAAFNREPALFKKKVDHLLVFAGDAQNTFTEYNVSLDVMAYVRIMTSGLPLYWVPCFDGGLWKNAGNASFFRADQARLLEDLPDALMNFFIYALLQKDEDDPIGFLYRKVDETERRALLRGSRNLWCAPLFTFPAGRSIVQRGSRFLALAPRRIQARDKALRLFDFKRVAVRMRTRDGTVFTGGKKVRRFQILDRSLYGDAMTSVTNALLASFGK